MAGRWSGAVVAAAGVERGAAAGWRWAVGEGGRAFSGYAMYATRTFAVKRVESANRPTVVEGFIDATTWMFCSPTKSRFLS